jgi:hypothetical protein
MDEQNLKNYKKKRKKKKKVTLTWNALQYGSISCWLWEFRHGGTPASCRASVEAIFISM